MPNLTENQRRTIKLAGVKPLAESKLPAKFADSTEATEFIDDLLQRMESKALAAWANDTDHNFGTTCVMDLRTAIESFNKFVTELEEAS
jgi:hypothetical protein